MDKSRLVKQWFPLAVVAALALSDSFLLVAIGLPLALLFLICDVRPFSRRLALVMLVLVLVGAVMLPPVPLLFAVVAGGCFVWFLRMNFFSFVTSSALLSTIISVLITVAVVAVTGEKHWRRIEEETTAVLHQKWQSAVYQSEKDPGSGEIAQTEQAVKPELAEKWERWNKMMITLLPGWLALIMIAALFGVVIIFRCIGQYDLPLSVGCKQFRNYRFEDQWIWLFIVGQVLFLVFSQEWITRLALNIFLVMGALYVMRGLAVMFYFIAMRGGGLIHKILLVIMMVPPLCLFHLVFGLLDTWVDFRKAMPAGR